MSRQLQTSKKGGSAAQCVIDRNILNKNTLPKMKDVGLSVFAPLCGKNRGAFVLEEADGHTYGCANFPTNIVELSGAAASFGSNSSNVTIKDASAVNTQYAAGNITSSDVIDIADFIVKSVYHSTSNIDNDPNACDVGGLATLKCEGDDDASPLFGGDSNVIRSVTLPGVFGTNNNDLWVTGGKVLTIEEAETFYTAKDFSEMKTLGLNTVQIPMPFSAFSTDTHHKEAMDVLDKMLQLINDAQLKAILVLVDDINDGSVDDETVVSGTVTYASSLSKYDDVVIAITLPSAEASIVAAATSKASTLTTKLSFFVPTSIDQLRHLHRTVGTNNNVYAALDMDHTTKIEDVASSSSLDDRFKLTFHESKACVSRSSIEYASCIQNVPVFISNGFDLSIDNCINHDTEAAFVDYGQCDRFNETIHSPWWEDHRTSFAKRQLFAYELGLGWSFAAWKLYDDDDEKVGLIDSPAKLLTLKNVAAAGLMPSLTQQKQSSAVQLACLNPPESDYLLGDDTAAPSPGPPPDCGNGWWNVTTKVCDYWIPPAPTAEPTMPPTEPCPVCEICSTCQPPLTNKALGIAAISGAAVALVIGAIGLKVFGRKRKDGYNSLP